jgi:predicted O-methyltransferase YrrM
VDLIGMVWDSRKGDERMKSQVVIDQIRQKRTVTSADGQTYPIRQYPIDATEGRFLSEFIANRPNITRTLEAGCAYGLSSLYIADALADRPRAHHLIVDPFQHTDWHGIGVAKPGPCWG